MQGLAIVIPAYRAEKTLRKVILGALEYARWVIVVDDASPDGSAGIAAAEARSDERVVLVRHAENQGVGGAVWSGYQRALSLGAQVVVKMDSDDQMDPAWIPHLVSPLYAGQADYVKGNRFMHAGQIFSMPLVRRLGNISLSFLTKVCSGYWNVFDPTNGYTALHAAVIPLLDPARLHRRYFFETSMLIELYLHRAVVKDVYIPARYTGEQSHLSVVDSLLRFPPLLFQSFLRRVTVEYFVKDFNAASMMVSAGLPMILFGLVFGGYHWARSIREGIPATTGTVMVATLPFILGFQLLLQAVVQDIHNVPSSPVHLVEINPGRSTQNEGCGR
jgi:glycosyltransferase involved in cell wall biosynthesis